MSLSNQLFQDLLLLVFVWQLIRGLTHMATISVQGVRMLVFRDARDDLFWSMTDGTDPTARISSRLSGRDGDPSRRSGVWTGSEHRAERSGSLQDCDSNPLWLLGPTSFGPCRHSPKTSLVSLSRLTLCSNDQAGAGGTTGSGQTTYHFWLRGTIESQAGSVGLEDQYGLCGAVALNHPTPYRGVRTTGAQTSPSSAWMGTTSQRSGGKPKN